MRNAQAALFSSLKSLSELVVHFWAAQVERDIYIARESIVAHPECSGVFLEELLTTERSPRSESLLDGAWRSHILELFRAMVKDPKITFDNALKVWEHPNYREQTSRHLDSSDLRELFEDLPIVEQ